MGGDSLWTDTTDSEFIDTTDSEWLSDGTTYALAMVDGIVLSDLVEAGLLYTEAVLDQVDFGDSVTDLIFVLEGEYISFSSVVKPTVTFTVVNPSVTFTVL